MYRNRTKTINYTEKIESGMQLNIASDILVK